MSEFPNLTGQRLAELWSGEGEPATAVEIKELAERADNQRRRAEVKTLRDEFAMSAMMGLLSNHTLEWVDSAYLAKEAYVAADAMLEARK